jgi:hypothetical protein
MVTMTSVPEAGSDTGSDPVLVKRAKVARLVNLGVRTGGGLFALAAVLFFTALIVGFSSTWTTLIGFCLIAGSVILAPAMVFMYAVKAADRADREGTW